MSNQEIYKKGTFKFFTDYTIKTSEMTVSLEQDDQVIRLLDNRSIDKHKKDGYNFIIYIYIYVYIYILYKKFILKKNASKHAWLSSKQDPIQFGVLEIQNSFFQVE